MPVAARGTVVPPQPGSDRTQLGLQLPLAGGTPAGLQGRCLLLLCRRSTQLASLLSLASWERSCSGWRQACGGSGCKPLTPGVAAGAAFGVLSSGARLSYLVIPLDGLGASGSGRAPGGVQQHKQRLRWKDGVLTTHVPAAPASGGAAPAAPFPWIELQQLGQQQAEEQQLGQEDSSKAAPLDCRLRLVEAGSGGERQAGSKRKAGALEEREAGEQAGATPPPPGPQQQQQQRQQQPLVDIYCCSFDDSRFVREAQRGYACPHRSCGGLRCHSAAGLQQHLHASHAYHNYQFWDAGDGTGLLEVYLRCKPGALVACVSFWTGGRASRAALRLPARLVLFQLSRTTTMRHLAVLLICFAPCPCLLCSLDRLQGPLPAKGPCCGAAAQLASRAAARGGRRSSITARRARGACGWVTAGCTRD